MNSDLSKDEECRSALTALSAHVDEYREQYEMCGEDAEGRDAYYTPNEHEAMLIHDAIEGLLGDEEFCELIMRYRIAFRETRIAKGCCPRCGHPYGDHWGKCDGK